MNSEEIKKHEVEQDAMYSEKFPYWNMALWLKEIAYQLAVINEHIKLIREESKGDLR